MIDEKKFISRLKNHKCSIDELCNLSSETSDKIVQFIESLKKKHVPIKLTSSGQYYLPVLPEAGNVYFISGSDKKKREIDFAATSDLHIGSIYFMKKTFNESMKRLEDKGIKRIYVAGDIVDGQGIYPGHLENLVSPSVEDQTDIAAEILSKHPNLEFWGISGNHDYSHTKLCGVKPLSLIESKIDNFKNLGDIRADIIYHGIRIRLVHGAGGRVYSKSYPSQVYLRDLFGGSEREEIKNMPHIIIMGHYHTMYQGKDHGIHILQPSSFQDSENEYCVRKGLTGPNGCFRVHCDYKSGKIIGFETEYIQPEISFNEKGTVPSKRILL